MLSTRDDVVPIPSYHDRHSIPSHDRKIKEPTALKPPYMFARKGARSSLPARRKSVVRVRKCTALTHGTTLSTRENVLVERRRGVSRAHSHIPLDETCTFPQERAPQCLYDAAARHGSGGRPPEGTIVTNVVVCITRRRAIRAGLTVRDIDLQPWISNGKYWQVHRWDRWERERREGTRANRETCGFDGRRAATSLRAPV